MRFFSLRPPLLETGLPLNACRDSKILPLKAHGHYERSPGVPPSTINHIIGSEQVVNSPVHASKISPRMFRMLARILRLTTLVVVETEYSLLYIVCLTSGT